MSDNRIDNILIGKSYLSFLFAFTLMDNDKKVLLLDDKRSRYGNLFTGFLCHLEKKFLQLWGSERNLAPLADLDKYALKRPLTMIVNNCQVQLGNSPSKNYQEFLRKMPFCFKKNERLFFEPIKTKSAQKQLDEDYFNYCQRLAERIWEGTSSLEDVFFKDCPDNLTNIAELFISLLKDKENLHEEKRWIHNTLIYMSRGYYHKKLSVNGSRFEVFHLLLSLLSPHYELDQNLLLGDIQSLYLKKGGRFRQTKIREWYFDKGRPWRLGLESYDGVIWPKSISFFGGLPSAMPIEFGTKTETYTCVNIHWKLNTKNTPFRTHEKFFFSSVDNIGTDYPIWETHFTPEGLKLKLFTVNRPGNKISFIKKKIHELLVLRLSPFIPKLETLIQEETMTFSPEIITTENIISSKKKQSQQIPIYDISSTTKKIQLKSVDYFGPFKKGSLGLLSTLLELKQDPSADLF